MMPRTWTIATVALVSISAPAAAQAPAGFREWAVANAVPADSAGLVRGLDRLLGGVVLIGVGESVHNQEPMLAFRTRILQELVRRHRATALVLESGLPEAMAIDWYVTGRVATIDYGTAFTYGFGAFLEVRRAIEWLRSWNAGPGRDHPVHVYGSDLPASAGSMVPALDRLVELVGDQDPALATAVAAIRPLATRIAGSFWRAAAIRYDSLTRPGKDSLRAGAARVAEGAATFQSRDAEKTAWVRRVGLVVSQAELALRVGALDPSNPRDRAMDANTRWTLSRIRPGERAVLWEHNAHVQRIPIEGPALPGGLRATPMGMTLSDSLGKKYLAIGTAYGGPSVDSTAAPVLGSIDAELGRLGIEAPFLLPLSTAPAPIAAWLHAPRPMRFQVSHLMVAPARAFDAIVYFDRVEPARTAP